MHRLLITLAALSCAASPNVALPQDRGGDLSVYLRLATDYRFRGVSKTNENLAVQAGLDYEHETGVFVGAWASNIEFPVYELQEDRREIELDLYLGLSRRLGRRWSALVGVVRYAYPGTSIVGDYTELAAGLAYDQRVFLNVAHSEDWLGLGVSATDYALSWQQPLSRAWELGATAGLLDTGYLPGGGYTYWNLGLTKGLGRFSVDVRFHDTSDDAVRAFGDLAGNRWVLSLGAAF
jgi:uncharacterized protein (TIGR02001 family)